MREDSLGNSEYLRLLKTDAASENGAHRSSTSKTYGNNHLYPQGEPS